MAYVNVHVNWGGVGHVNVHVHLRGMLMLWVVLTFIFTGVGWGGVGHVNVYVHLPFIVHVRHIALWERIIQWIYRHNSRV